MQQEKQKNEWTIRIIQNLSQFFGLYPFYVCKRLKVKGILGTYKNLFDICKRRTIENIFGIDTVALRY